MPYAGPNGPSTSPRIRNHRRSYSFSDEKGPGAFTSLGALPKNQHKATPKKPPAFHFKGDDDDSPEDDQHFAPLSIVTRNLCPLHDERAPANDQSCPSKGEPTAPATVLFPKSSPLSPTLEGMPQLTPSTPLRHPMLSRGTLDPVLLSNGKPLKSLLKSRSPSISSSPDGLRSMHLRVQSAPTTPNLSKNVRFPEKKEDGLESVRVFHLKARPASLSQGCDDTETETETEPSQFPFPRYGINTSGHGRYPLAFGVDNFTPGVTSTIPVANPPPDANIHFESAAFVQPEAPFAPHLTGIILVLNVAYEKHVAVRFTLDEWQTTIEVRARYVVSVQCLPWEMTHNQTLGDAIGLQERVLWFVGRYTATGDGGGEWWDNNSGLNYRVGFKVAAGKGRDRIGRTISAPGRFLATPQPTKGPAPTISQPSYSRTPFPRPPQRETKSSSSNNAAPSYPGQLVEPRSNGTLQWPWAFDSNSDSDSPSGFGTGSESNSPQLHFSPRDMTPPTSSFDSYSGSPQPRSGTSSPKIIDTDLDHLYDAFVKQWCFAQSPIPGLG
ncbi:carbohydrate-binding module family 21 protein [Piloderma croceum F 1598]|uniref:Carbohydrate-binding module family 21 protein n=1 Tax=Piloderma croceum (strain F 1598) TaxID=765440 RepID=A0A0C3CET4_PILCF|nr:carbohydrate-binding module family 21 protein [Piloderma croceum F 1598]